MITQILSDDTGMFDRLIHHFKKHMEVYHVPLIKVNRIESFLYLLTSISSVMNIPQSSLLAKFLGIRGPVGLMNATSNHHPWGTESHHFRSADAEKIKTVESDDYSSIITQTLCYHHHHH